MKKCKLCKNDFEPIDKEHIYCPSCWDKIYRENHPDEFKKHRICQYPGCNTIIDDQPENFRYCVRCWNKRKDEEKRLNNKSEKL